jgi:hypothetical protein
MKKTKPAQQPPKTYADYTVMISTDPSYYGSDCTNHRAMQIVYSLGKLIRGEFPRVNIEDYSDGMSSSFTTGPDDQVVDEIDQWIETNWTAAL